MACYSGSFTLLCQSRFVTTKYEGM
jgi:hypothetical protein